MVGNVTILVVPVSANQDTLESTVKQGFVLKEFMVSSVIKSVPATSLIPGAVTLCLGNAPASLVGLGSTATRHVPRGSMVSHVSRSAAAKMVLTAIA